MVLRLIPAAALIALLIVVIGRLAGDGGPTPASEVALDIRDQVTRDIIARTEDYSVTVGPLDCVALQPGKGNCLADVKLAGHRSDNVMVAVSYTDAGNGYDLVIKMP